jgi:hypothetical protein
LCRGNFLGVAHFSISSCVARWVNDTPGQQPKACRSSQFCDMLTSGVLWPRLINTAMRDGSGRPRLDKLRPCAALSLMLLSGLSYTPNLCRHRPACARRKTVYWVGSRRRKSFRAPCNYVNLTIRRDQVSECSLIADCNNVDKFAADAGRANHDLVCAVIHGLYSGSKPK